MRASCSDGDELLVDGPLSPKRGNVAVSVRRQTFVKFLEVSVGGVIVRAENASARRSSSGSSATFSSGVRSPFADGGLPVRSERCSGVVDVKSF
ncbi:hypothetical protein EDF43_111152 [Rathayibacter sp. PhB179]|nr:hypothetical protein EDF49_11143 [Rathayibacter sp. PhB192]TCM25324.1 hypothetical protein EDF43_111152 [Rathayibacter sp. PhB179]